jgi:hypothetical protein
MAPGIDDNTCENNHTLNLQEPEGIVIDKKDNGSKKRKVDVAFHQQYSNDIINDALISTSLELAVQKDFYKHETKKLKLENTKLQTQIATLSTGLNDLLDKLKTKYSHQSSPFLSACEEGILTDVSLFVLSHDTSSGLSKQDMIDKLYTNKHNWECTGLMSAAGNEKVEIVKYLLDQHADVSIKNGAGQNVLHIAAWYNKINVNTIKLLLKNMSLNDINAIDQSSLTPLDIAYNCYTPIRNEIIKLIRKHGGKANKFANAME